MAYVCTLKVTVLGFSCCQLVICRQGVPWGEKDFRNPKYHSSYYFELHFHSEGLTVGAETTIIT